MNQQAFILGYMVKQAGLGDMLKTKIQGIGAAAAKQVRGIVPATATGRSVPAKPGFLDSLKKTPLNTEPIWNQPPR